MKLLQVLLLVNFTTAFLLVLTPAVVRGQTYNLRETTYTELESANHVIIEITRTGDVSQPTSVLVVTIPGTATSPQDFTTLNQRREFITNSRSLTVRINFEEDDLREGDEWFQVRISDPSSGGTIGSDYVANITIQDDDAQFSFEMRAYPLVSESDGSITIAVVRQGYANKEANVYISTLDGDGSSDSATPGEDFVRLVETRLNFNSGEDKVTTQVEIIPDQVPEYTESLVVQIVRVEGGEIGPVSTATVSIDDDDVQYEIVEDSFSAKERTGLNQVVVTITRRYNLQTASSIQVYTEDGTATSLSGDYVTFFSRVGFAIGQISARATITILDDNVYEPQGEVFYVGIRDPTPNGFVLASASRRAVRIEDNESILSLASSVYTVEESDESVTVQVRRTGDLSQQSSVRIRSLAVSATPDLDYAAFDLKLTFAANQQGVDLRIAITNDDVAGEDSEVFLVELYQAAVSILDSNATTATITIQDSPRLATLAIVLIVVGCTIFVIIILIMILCCCAFMRPSRSREPFNYDRGTRNVPGVDFPQELSGRGPVATYIPDDSGDQRRNLQDRQRRSERHTNGSAVQNGGTRIIEISETGNRPSRRDTNRASVDQPPPPPPPAQERPIEGRSGDPEAPADRHDEQSDPRRTRSMFNPRGERDPYWGKARHSYHSSPNHYGYF